MKKIEFTSAELNQLIACVVCYNEVTFKDVSMPLVDSLVEKLVNA